MMKEDVIRLNEQLKGKKAEEVLDYFLEKYQGHIALASSLGIEDQVLTAMICGIDATTRIFTLDTGRLFPEYDIWNPDSGIFPGLSRSGKNGGGTWGEFVLR